MQAFVFFLPFVFVSTVGHAEPKKPASEVERLVKERETFGDKLLSVLNDPKAKASNRLKAATDLGELRYAPAINSLIRHMFLMDPTARRPRTEWDDTDPYPCAQGRKIQATRSSCRL